MQVDSNDLKYNLNKISHPSMSISHYREKRQFEQEDQYKDEINEEHQFNKDYIKRDPQFN